MEDPPSEGEPGWVAALDGWVAALDGHLAAAAGHRGTLVSIGLAVALAAIALGVLHPATGRAAVVLAVSVATVLWVVENFGGVLIGTGTAVNSGPLLALLAAAYWRHTHRTAAAAVGS